MDIMKISHITMCVLVLWIVLVLYWFTVHLWMPSMGSTARTEATHGAPYCGPL